MYWPNINKQLEEVVRCFDACQEFQRKQSAEPILEHETPTEPWSKVASDLFSVSGKDYLIIADYDSKYFDVPQIPDKSSQIVIQHTKNIFSRFGIPSEVVSDNGPCYSSINYKRFAKEWDFKDVTSSPEYPRSNRMVEHTIQTVKRTIKKCRIKNEDVHLALLILRSTNKKGFEKSPGEILMKRTLRTTLPSVKTFGSGSFEESKTLKQNLGGHALKPLKVGDRVRTHNGKTWSQTGTVESIDNNPRSYLIKRDAGVKNKVEQSPFVDDSKCSSYAISRFR